MFWNILVLIWLSNKRMFSGKRTPLATHFYYTWDAEETVSSPSLAGVLGWASRAVEGRASRPSRQRWLPSWPWIHSSLLVQHFKSWPSWRPTGFTFYSDIKSYQTSVVLWVSTPRLVVPKAYASLIHRSYTTCWEYRKMEWLMAKPLCTPGFCSRGKCMHRKWCWPLNMWCLVGL